MPYIGNPITSGENNSFKVLDDITSYTLTFNGSSASIVSVANNTITYNSHRFITGQRVTYNTTGTTITGLTAATVYFIIKEDQNTIKLATTYANAINNTAIDLTGLGTGTTHTINVAFDGVNTKFKATYDNGTKAQITRAAQLTLSVNGVIQQPQDTTSPTNGFGIDLDSVIIFSVAPLVTDIFWGNLVANNFPTFDISDNTVDSFTGTGSLTAFTLSKEPANSQNLLVTIDGVVQYPNDANVTRAYSVVSNVLTFEGAPGNGTDIQVRHIGFAGATSSNVTGFYGRTGNVGLTTADNVNVGNLVVSGITTVSAGTTALPSISPSGDSNTGIFFPAADTIAASTGGTSRITIDSSGNINIDNGTVFVDAANNRFGIGSISPGTTLEVNGTIASKAGNNASKIQLGNESKWSISTNVIDSIYNDRILLFQSESSLGTFDWENNAGTGKLMRLDYSGSLLIGTTTANANGGILQLKSGITFPATAVAASDANTLDDYEEGTWEPRIADDGTAFVGTTYNGRNGIYRKVGSLVYVSYDIDVLLAGTLTGNASIGNLPFPVANSGDLRNGGGSIGYITGIQQNYVYQSNYPQNNSSYLFIIGRTAASNTTSLVSSSNFFANSMRITGQAWYSV